MYAHHVCKGGSEKIGQEEKGIVLVERAEGLVDGTVGFYRVCQ